jgi:hypothetical protein
MKDEKRAISVPGQYMQFAGISTREILPFEAPTGSRLRSMT